MRPWHGASLRPRPRTSRGDTRSGAPLPGQVSPQTRRWTPSWPTDLVTTLGVLQHGRADPTIRVVGSEVWRATRTPVGPATVHYARDGADVVITGWGPGAAWELDTVPELLGQDDDPAGFDHQAHPVMSQAHRRFGAGWRLARTTRVLESLVPAILEQRVTGQEARQAWARLVRRFGDPAPGPPSASQHSGTGTPRPLAGSRLLTAPDGTTWATIASWAWHEAGVDPGRARTISTAARRADTIERLSSRPAPEAARALATLPGIGHWTAAEVAVRAWGDRDAVSFGDYHLARSVVFTLTGRRDGDDEQLAHLLAPWAGQRARAVRLLLLHGGHGPDRRGPRSTITDHRSW